MDGMEPHSRNCEADGRCKLIHPVRIDEAAYYSDSDVATLLGVSPDTLRRHRQEKTGLPFSKFGRQIFYLGADIKASLEAGRQNLHPQEKQ